MLIKGALVIAQNFVDYIDICGGNLTQKDTVAPTSIRLKGLSNMEKCARKICLICTASYSR
jgi:hypothetical protein